MFVDCILVFCRMNQHFIDVQTTIPAGSTMVFAGETTIFPGETTNYHPLPVFNNKTTQSVANPGPGSSPKTAASCRISRSSSRHICHCCARSQADMVLFQLMTCENS